ncbi:MAG: ankyrin repeat domain-containing protein, partial [Planctomycetota bacterium]
GSIALFAAISRRRPQTVRSLINSGANVNARSEEGLTPLMMAASKGYDEIVLLLKIKVAELNVADAGGRTAVQLAMNAGHENTVAILKDARVRATDKSNKLRTNTSNSILA